MDKKSIKRYFILSFAILSFFISIGYSQKQYVVEPVVSTTFSKDTIMIGDQIELRITIDKDIMQATQFPEFEDGFGGIVEILEEGSVDTLKKDGRRITIKKDYLITCFKEGNYNLGLFPILNKEKNILDTIFSKDSMLLYVNTFQIDTTKHTLTDITPPLEAPLQFEEIKSYVFGGILALILLTIVIYLLVKYFKKKAATVAQIPLLPPHIEAMNELEKIYPLKLWKEGKHKIYYTKLSDIIRIYIERRYDISAMELTTDEIFSMLKNIDVSKESQTSLREFLMLSDLVKFAKLEPTEDENETSFKQAYDFVMDTKQSIIDAQKGDEDDKAKGKGI